MNMPGTGPTTHEIQDQRLGRRTSADVVTRVASYDLPRSAVLCRPRRAPGIACGFGCRASMFRQFSPPNVTASGHRCGRRFSWPRSLLKRMRGKREF